MQILTSRRKSEYILSPFKNKFSVKKSLSPLEVVGSLNHLKIINYCHKISVLDVFQGFEYLSVVIPVQEMKKSLMQCLICMAAGLLKICLLVVVIVIWDHFFLYQVLEDCQSSLLA